MRNLLRRLARRYGLFLGIASGVMAGFQFIICVVVSKLNIPALLTELLKNLPPAANAFIVQYIGGLGPADMLAFGWNHPIALAVGGAVAIVLAARAVAGEIEAGTLELVLSQPISRSRYFLGQATFAIAGLAAMTLAGALATLLGQRVLGLDALSPRTLVSVAVNFCLLQIAWFGVTVLLSVFGREAGRVAFSGFIVALLSYLIQVVAGLWPAAASLLPYAPNAYYDPRVILKSGALPAKSVAVLGGLAIASALFALLRFRRRDIP